MRLINIGFGNMIAVDRVLAIVTPESAPVKRMVKEAREQSCLIDATCGRKTRSVLVMDNNRIILSAVLPESIANRIE